MINSNAIRRDFPILNKEGKPLVYFDNACMSLRPTPVIKAITSYYNDLSACAGRSNHHLAEWVSKAVDEARDKVAKFVNASRKEEVVFTRNTSEGLNLVAHSLGLKLGDVVVIGDKEHNSNLVPWLKLKETIGITVRVVKSTDTNEVDLARWEEALHGNVKLASFGYCSNLDGVTNPVKEMTKLAHQAGAVVLVDAAQAIPHRPVNVRDLDVDFLAFSVHKMCGPSGMGVLYGKFDALTKLDPFMVGGDTVEKTSYDSYTMLPVPEKFEAGLQDYAGIIGTGAAVDYLTAIGLENIHRHEIELNTYLTGELGRFGRVHIIGPKEAEKRGGVTGFTVDNADHHQVALMLDRVGNVEVRSGQHCCHSWFTGRGVPGSVRTSLYLYNTKDEVDIFIKTLEQVLSVT